MMFQNTTSIPVSNRATDEKTPFLGMEKKKNPYNIFVFCIISPMANIQRWTVRSGILSFPPQEKAMQSVANY